MNYASELKKFISSQYIYSGVRIALAIVVPALILAHFGLLKEYFLFPLGTSFVGLTDQPGPFIRRRNALIMAVVTFFLVAATASFLKDFQPLIYVEIIFFGFFFSIIGVYGQRLAAVGSLALVVLAIFIDGHLTGTYILKSLLIFLAGCSWFFVIFLIVSKIQPYKLAGQMIGENYLELADYLRIKAKFYQPNPDYDGLFTQLISKQVRIKNLQEETRETVFRTRTIVNESTTTSRILMLLFLNSIDLHEMLMTSENDYRKVQQRFSESEILPEISTYLENLATEISNIGIALQSGTKPNANPQISEQLYHIHEKYFDLRMQSLNSETLEDFMILRQIFMRITEVSDEVKSIYSVFSQDEKHAKSLSTGLDYQKFLPKEEKLNLNVLKNNFSFDSQHFRHAIRVTIALLIGYGFSKLTFLGIGHSYWILITIIAILKPAYSTTKSRNLLRLYGTVVGGIIAYVLLYFVHNNSVLLFTLLGSMILCFSLLKSKYFWAVLFMTVYIFLSFNFLKPGNINLIFKDRILDTAIAGVVAFAVSYLVLPVWEHTQNLDLIKKSLAKNQNYFETAFSFLLNTRAETEAYKISRKDAIVALANLSDNFQRMISDPKNQQKKLELVHQFVTTSHLFTAYTASLSRYAKTGEKYPEIDAEKWQTKINAELKRTENLLNFENFDENIRWQSHLKPSGLVEDLMDQRKTEISENEFFDRRDPNRITHLTELKNIQELLELIYDVAREQRKVAEKMSEYLSNLQS